MKLADLGEFGFIDRIARSVPAGTGVRLGIGDDCAALTLPPDELLLTTTDLLIEQVHFRREWTDLRMLGRKSVAVNVSDIAAMGGRPRHLFLGLAVPVGISVEDLDDFVAGFLEAARYYDVTLAGGDTCRSPGGLMISVTAEGTVPERELTRRSGARPGDAVYVSGTLGDSGLALQRLLAGQAPEPFLARRHHDPQARTGLGRALARATIPTAMIDVSDGLLADLGHILESSQVGAVIEATALPLSEPFRRALAMEPALFDLALAGGEDYELLFTVALEREAELAELAKSMEVPVTRLGCITGPETGLTVVDRDGRPITSRKTGFDHFG